MNSKNILDHFSQLPDPREDNKRHKLIDIIAIVLCASICGAEKWEDIETFGRAKESWFRKVLDLPHGIPSPWPWAPGRLTSTTIIPIVGAHFRRR
jgi:hypothetical protein